MQPLARLLSARPPARLAHALLLVAQLVVVWGLWDRRDLTSGDTSAYYVMAAAVARDGDVNPLWSPLYTIFYGLFVGGGELPEPATTLHRLAIYLAAGQLVLVVTRRLLSPGLAWLVAAWWCCHPITFAALYEVHLFAFLPLLITWVVAAGAPGPGRRGAVLALLLGATLLVRNELVVATCLWAAVCVWTERARRDESSGRRLAVAYGVPLALLGVLLAGILTRSSVPGLAELRAGMRQKHAVNMAQVYAAGYQQRHPEWTSNPWTEPGALVAETFGEPEPSLGTMLARNPAAVAEHFLWNLRLTPAGLQVLLLNATSFEHNPDYAPVRLRAKYAALPSLAILAVWAGGLFAACRDRRRWSRWVRRRGPLLVTMGCVVATSLPVILTQRPRPSYLFPLGLTLMVCAGLGLEALLRCLPWRSSRTRLLVVALVPVFLLAVPLRCRPRRQERLLARTVERLWPFREHFRRRGAVLLKGEFAGEVANYVGLGRPTILDHGALRGWDERTPLTALLAKRGVDLVYVDDWLLTRLEGLPPEVAGPFVGRDELRDGWRRLAAVDVEGDRWRLFAREPVTR